MAKFTGRGRAMWKVKDALGVTDRVNDHAAMHAKIYDPSTYPDLLSDLAQRVANTPKQEIAYQSFRDGAKWGIEEGHAEVLEENYQLHDMIIRLCIKFGVEPCPKCNANPVRIVETEEGVESCEACEGNGWIPKSTQSS